MKSLTFELGLSVSLIKGSFSGIIYKFFFQGFYLRISKWASHVFFTLPRICRRNLNQYYIQRLWSTAYSKPLARHIATKYHIVGTVERVETHIVSPWVEYYHHHHQNHWHHHHNDNFLYHRHGITIIIINIITVISYTVMIKNLFFQTK